MKLSIKSSVVALKSPTKLLAHSFPDKDSKIAYQLLSQAKHSTWWNLSTGIGSGSEKQKDKNQNNTFQASLLHSILFYHHRQHMEVGELVHGCLCPFSFSHFSSAPFRYGAPLGVSICFATGHTCLPGSAVSCWGSARADRTAPAPLHTTRPYSPTAANTWTVPLLVCFSILWHLLWENKQNEDPSCVHFSLGLFVVG